MPRLFGRKAQIVSCLKTFSIFYILFGIPRSVIATSVLSVLLFPCSPYSQNPAGFTAISRWSSKRDHHRLTKQKQFASRRDASHFHFQQEQTHFPPSVSLRRSGGPASYSSQSAVEFELRRSGIFFPDTFLNRIRNPEILPKRLKSPTRYADNPPNGTPSIL